jgi:hypothetical protein
MLYAKFLKVYIFRGVKDSGPSLVSLHEFIDTAVVWARTRRVGIDPRMLAVLLGATRTSHETHHDC